MKKTVARWADKNVEYLKSKVRCKVEFAFRFVKCTFGYRKAIYKGIKKNSR